MDDTKQSLIEHFKELRKRLLIVAAALIGNFIVCYLFKEDLRNFLLQPLAELLQNKNGGEMKYLFLPEAFFTYLRICFIFSLLFSFPVIAYQFYHFLSPGLYKKEKGFLMPFLIISPLLFLSGFLFAYYLVVPLAWEFFSSFAMDGDSLQLDVKISEYISLSLSFLFAFGFAFQLPIILVLLFKVGFITPDWLRKKRRYAIVIITIVSAVITPADIASQVTLILPLILFYEISIFICDFLNKKEAPPKQ